VRTDGWQAAGRKKDPLGEKVLKICRKIEPIALTIAENMLPSLTLAFFIEAPRAILPPLPEFVVRDVRLPSPDVAFFCANHGPLPR
jgi:hypothetical protein